MRRLGLTLVLLVAAMALPAAAQATFHLQTANEVMLASASGDTNVRFVELYDAGGAEESFPPTFGPYGLAVYDGSAHLLGSQALSAAGMASAAVANRPYLISTAAADTALEVTGDEVLTVALPKPVGQACYTAGGGTPFSCITWGCVKTFVSVSGTGSFHAATPPDGKSAQRQASGSVQIAAPTPKATNTAGAAPSICPPQFGGVVIPQQTATVKQAKVPVTVRCPAKAEGRCVGSLVLKTAKKIKTPSGQKRFVTLGHASFSILAGKAPKVQVPLSQAGKTALRKHDPLGAIATATARDGSGKSKVTSGKVTVKRPSK
ncbi:MAG: hypothetical protein ACJ760_13335 [Thermoleophilaceae bacterium]